jgi:glucokinase
MSLTNIVDQISQESGKVLLGLDIGGTKTAALVVDEGLNQLSAISRPTETSNPQRLVAGVVATVREVLSMAQMPSTELAGIGVAVPGLVDPESGVVELAVNLNLESYNLGITLAEELGAPVYLENDVRTAAMGAYQFARQEEPLNHLAYLSIGTGIAAGLVLSGQLYRGANGMAGEIGHIIVEHQGPKCGCGLVGCLEAVASGMAIARIGQEKLDSGEQPITAESVYESARKGNPSAIEIIRQVSVYLARAIQLLFMTYDVEKVVLGGGVTKPGPAFLGPILDQLSLFRAQSALAEAMLPAKKVAVLPAGYNAGVWGAIMLAMGTPVYAPS